MKKFSIILAALFLLAGLPVHANPVSADKALEIARMFFKAQPATKAAGGDVRIVWNGEAVATKAGVQPAFYVVARDGGGFVIIAGDDNVRPILALSENGRFETENMPDNVKWWMDRMAEYVRSASSQTDEVRQLWGRYAATKGEPAIITGTITDIVEHLTPEWRQGAPFNQFCPLQNEQATITGCVATALAEILTYQSGQYGNQMPASAHGTVGGYAATGGHVTPASYALGHTYDWEGMRALVDNDAINNAPQSVIESVARLMADCGAIVRAQYSTNATSAGFSYIASGFAEHFDFNPGAHIERPYNYSVSQWQAMLKAELVKRPIYYAGNGHAFVLDAFGRYDDDDVFHVNFGWGGYCNGYYYQTYLYDGDTNYTSDYGEALIDFFLDDGTCVALPSLRLENSDDCGIIAPARIRKGEDFALRCGWLGNGGNVPFTGSVRAVIVDKDGLFKVAIGGFLAGNPGLQPGFGWPDYQIDCYIPDETDIVFGDKIILEYAVDADNPTFVPVHYPANGTVLGEVPLMPAAFIHKESAYHTGDYFDFLLENHNYLYGSTIWKITFPSGTKRGFHQSSNRVKLTQPGTYKIEAEVHAKENGEILDRIVAHIVVN